MPYDHTSDMVTHMKTTLNIDDQLMRRLKREAAKQRTTMSALVETALRQLLAPPPAPRELPPLPVYHLGGALVDVANRDALHDAMEQNG